jgi:hypothetical protein
MRVLAIADLHLSFARPKPMDIFGEAWRDHHLQIATAWDERVGAEDAVLCPGDLSWAMRLDDAEPDLEWIGKRPGIKVLGRGNHDYWWSSVSRVRAAAPASCRVLHQDAVDLGEVVIAGARGWLAPTDPEATDQDRKIFARELGRLERSLTVAGQIVASRPLIAALHYPPFDAQGERTPVVELLEAAGVSVCAYGHLHSAEAHATAVEGLVGGIHYRLVACDAIGFAPVVVWPARSSQL